MGSLPRVPLTFDVLLLNFRASTLRERSTLLIGIQGLFEKEENLVLIREAEIFVAQSFAYYGAEKNQWEKDLAQT